MTPATSDPIASVVVVTYRSGPTLAPCLAALKAQTVGDFETILLDNASGDGLAEAAAAADPGLRFMPMDINHGFAGGNNRAANAARGRWLVLLNPDAYAAPDWLERMLAAAAAYPQVRCFTARQLMAGRPGRLDGLGDAMAAFGFPFRGGYGHPDRGAFAPAQVFSACGAAMMIDRALFLGLGGFDEDFFCYCEDSDLGYRLRLLGEPVLLIPDAVVRHEGSASTGGRRSDFSLFHGARNRPWTLLKNAPPLLLGLTLPAFVAVTLALWAAAALRGEGRPVARGVRAAIAGLPGVFAKRRAIQAGRKATSWDIGRMMLWNPLAVARRDAKLRPFPLRSIRKG